MNTSIVWTFGSSYFNPHCHRFSCCVEQMLSLLAEKFPQHQKQTLKIRPSNRPLLVLLKPHSRVVRCADGVFSDIRLLIIASMMFVFAVHRQYHSNSSCPGPHTPSNRQQALLRKHDGTSGRSTAAGASPAQKFPPRFLIAVVVHDQPKEAAEE